MVGHGSKHSPIYISDDDSEDADFQPAQFMPVPPPAPPKTLPLPHHSMPQAPRVPKRKRDDAFRQGSSRDGGHQESKKARKRRRKLEREQAMAQARNQPPPFSLLPFLPSILPWVPPPIQFPPLAHPFAGPLVSHPPPMARQHNDAQPSPWVSSMAAAGSSNRNQHPVVESLESPPAPPPPSFSVPLPVPPLSLPPTSPPAAVRKPASLIIGMNPDPDRNSKHGTFAYSPLTITSIAQNGKSNQYIPNPARTIVMEQLPKTHRTRDFIKTWSKGACGAHPVYFAVDPQSAKALVEFATAELARKAWASPKISAPGQPIKGKPRADLIRVWWYRVEGVGAGAGVGELEEGEIEGDEEEREISLPPSEPTALVKKETKKERKARLAKDRALKLAKTQPQSADSSVSILPPVVYPEPPILLHRDSAAYPTPVWPMDPNWASNADTASTMPTGFAQWSAPMDTSADWNNFRLPALSPSISSLQAAHLETDVDADMDLDAAAPLPLSLSRVASSTSDRSSAGAPAASANQGSMTPPLEPRAMKNAPKGPSFVKRSLLARQKELEGRIAKGKLELEAKGIPMDMPPTQDTASMEDNLRQLVLKSQKSKLKAPILPFADSAPVIIPAPPPAESTPSSGGSSHSITPPPTVTISALSFDDMAVSFITETIQNLVPGAMPMRPPAKSTGLKEELAAKQRLLEADIAETKLLMTQLRSAKSKQEKERILGLMREKSRCVFCAVISRQ
ncbi:hypothetical protein C8F01DRAFT_1128179 [Mycena amicta]|nr:hypothetical protein C8F01DRAFT_1128179 [Mycena amicta]